VVVVVAVAAAIVVVIVVVVVVVAAEVVVVVVVVMVRAIIIIISTIRDNEKGTCILIAVVIPGDINVIKKVAEKILKYKDALIEIHCM
jgi:hypothetical protein